MYSLSKYIISIEVYILTNIYWPIDQNTSAPKVLYKSDLLYISDVHSFL